ncbi:RND transporter [Ilyomonas limi]|uniref:RND transporter n=1 Tax=Ilyomonas limi TaxID=2575867 RepID=A0A4U3KT89_9BACT|nr:MMPL family transporter [Ilyomonas limi]TKK65532.1 RND transporter [Ilyomonas limi]
MWFSLGRFILRFRLPLLFLLLVITAFMGYHATKVQMSYEFSKAIPTDNPKYIQYQQYVQQFGQSGNTLVLGFQTPDLYTTNVFNAAGNLHQQLRTVPGVEGILSVPEAINLVKNDSLDKLQTERIFHYPYTSQALLDSDKATFENLPFYQNLLYNPQTHSYLMALQLNKDSANSKARTALINRIIGKVQGFENGTNIDVHISGLPYIRTVVANKIAKELNYFLLGSFVLSAITLLLFFRSFSAMLMSLLVVGMGVVWSLATMVFFGYKITLLTALIPPLIVVIGIPNCIYFLNKYHASYLEKENKREALVTMVGRMGIVTLFCNIAAAIGFAVFALTKSDLLKEFGVVSGINVMALFFISLIFIPAVLSYLPPPKPHQLRYLNNYFLEKVLSRIEHWTFTKSSWVYAITVVVLAIAVAGIFRLKSEGYIVDDLPKTDVIYTDLKWFEQNFNGVMPLEIVIDTKRKNGLFKNLQPIEKIDRFSYYIASQPETAKPLSFVEGLKFVTQAFYGGDSTSYTLPTEFDAPLIVGLLKNPDTAGTTKSNTVTTLMNSFIDSNKQKAHISVNMKDIGSKRLPVLLDSFQKKAAQIFDTSRYNVTITGTGVTFLEGTNFIINGLKESILYAFGLIALCMLYLFKSFRILLCSLIPNLVPLVVTAGVMGWTGVALKPSTVLVFSVALGIAIDVTIRFLINYKQELPQYNKQVNLTLSKTIRHTGISIIYTSLVLIAGFIIFCFSEFGGTRGLGWLTSLTLVVGTLTNLILLPVLLKRRNTVK